MLLLDLNTIKTPRERFDKVYEADQCGVVEDFTIVGPVSLGFDIFRDKDQVRLAGSVSATLELGCSRCLEPFRVLVGQAFDLRYQPRSRNAGEGERELQEDDLTTAFYDHETIDLGELMREQFFLALPMKPLCGEACRGLCPECGTNLNSGRCNCTRRSEDPRLAVLKSLKTDS